MRNEADRKPSVICITPPSRPETNSDQWFSAQKGARNEENSSCYDVITKFSCHDVIISVVAGGAGDIWWIFVIIVAILLLLILVMLGVRYKERNTEISYYGEYIMNLVIIGSGNGLSFVCHHVITGANVTLVSIQHPWT